MNIPHASFRVRIPARSLLILLAALAPGAVLAQSEGSSQAERDVDAARSAADADRRAATGGAGSSSGSSASKPSSGGIGAPRRDTTEESRPRDEAADAVERSRARALPGARPDEAPPARARERATTDLPPGVSSDGGPAVTGGASTGTAIGATTATGDVVLRNNDGTLSDGRQAAAARDAETTARMIGEASFAYRDRAMSMAESELSSGGQLASSIERGSVNVSGAPRLKLNDSIKRVNEARNEYAKAISRARSANETRWNDSREEVVESYNAYRKALDEAREAAVEGGARLD